MRRDFMALGAEHEQAAGLEGLFLEPRNLAADVIGARAFLALARILDVGELLADAHVGIAAELDVGAASGHVGGDGDRAGHAGLGDDVGFLLVITRIEDGEHLHLGRTFVARIERGEGIGIGEVVLLPAVGAQQLGELLGLLDGGGADQDRLAALLAVLDQGEDRAVLLLGGAIDLVVVVEPRQRHVGRDLQHFETVDVVELVRLGERRAGHAGELLVHAEIVLERDRGQRLVFRLDRLALLGLERLVEAFRVAPARHHAAGEFVDDDDLAVAHDIVLVALEQRVRAQRLIDVVHGRDVLDVVEGIGLEQPGRLEELLHLFHAGFGHADGALLLVDLVVGLVELGNVAVDGVVEFGAVVERAGDDQRRARLVDQDRVHFVDDRIDVAALDHVLQPVFHVVAQIVEAELVVGAVGDIAAVGLLALLVVQPVDDDADGETEERVDLAHPFGVAAGEVVVDGDHMHAAAGQRVEIDRKGRDQRLAFAGLHLRDAAFMQDHAAGELDVEMALAEGALGGLAHRGEGRHQDIVERFAGGQFLLEGVGAQAQRVVGEPFELFFQGVDRLDAGAKGANAPIIGRTEKLAGHGAEHAGDPFSSTRGVPRDQYRTAGIVPNAFGMRHFSGETRRALECPRSGTGERWRDRRGCHPCQSGRAAICRNHARIGSRGPSPISGPRMAEQVSPLTVLKSWGDLPNPMGAIGLGRTARKQAPVANRGRLRECAPLPRTGRSRANP